MGRGKDSTNVPSNAHSATFCHICDDKEAPTFGDTSSPLQLIKWPSMAVPSTVAPTKHANEPAIDLLRFHGSLEDVTLAPTTSASPSPPHSVAIAIIAAGCLQHSTATAAWTIP